MLNTKTHWALDYPVRVDGNRIRLSGRSCQSFWRVSDFICCDFLVWCSVIFLSCLQKGGTLQLLQLLRGPTHWKYFFYLKMEWSETFIICKIKSNGLWVMKVALGLISRCHYYEANNCSAPPIAPGVNFFTYLFVFSVRQHYNEPF